MKDSLIPRFMKEKKNLNQNIIIQEISDAIKKFLKDKALGPDDLTAMYYKCLDEKLILTLQKVMNQISKKKLLLQSWQELQTTSIHKEGNDSVLCNLIDLYFC